MLGYAQGRPAVAERRSSPNTLLAVILVHVAVIALVMSARMDLPARFKEPPLTIDLIPEQAPPPPAPSDPQVKPRPSELAVTQPQPAVPLPPSESVTIPSVPLPGGELVGPATDPVPPTQALPTPAPVRNAAQLLTSGADLRPPYPPAKLLTEEEADLRLKLTIDLDGRVSAVEPVGRADAVFLAAARRHLIATWRFRPATEDGRPVVSTTMITLRFRLD